MNSINWQWWHYFLVIAEQGSLSKAAIQLKLSQPTLSRHLAALEKQLGQTLFDRSSQGLILTDFASRLIDESKNMRDTAAKLERFVSGHEQQLEGSVRLAVAEPTAMYNLPQVLPKFLSTYPDVRVEVVMSNFETNLGNRDADLAIRAFAPTQQDLIARHLFDLPLGFFATEEYLLKNGTPKTLKELFQLNVFGPDRDPLELNWIRSMAQPATISASDFYFRSDFMPLRFELVKMGHGITIVDCYLGHKSGLVQIEVEASLPTLPIYLTCHRDVRHNRKIRVMMDYLAEILSKNFSSWIAEFSRMSNPGS